MIERWPIEVRLVSARNCLVVVYDNGQTFDIPAELLRVESPSAEVQGHHPVEKQIIEGKENVRILKVEPIGNYAVKLTFDDGHDTGLFTWAYLYQLGIMAHQAH